MNNENLYKFKLHINSNLIRSNNSLLPDELKNIPGLNVYDENDFEREFNVI